MFLCAKRFTDFIKNNELPSCVNCVHFIEQPHGYQNDRSEFGKCKLFGEKNLVSGGIKYMFAANCRQKGLCGTEGKYFEESA
jgi:hypothetical protein